MQNREVIEQAKQLIQQNKLKEAEEILSKINDKYAIFEIAKIKLIQGNDNEAEELYKKVLTLDDTIHEAVLELARIYARQKRTDLAMELISSTPLPDCINQSINDVIKSLGLQPYSMTELPDSFMMMIKKKMKMNSYK